MSAGLEEVTELGDGEGVDPVVVEAVDAGGS
jgi:hypothetical protein